MKEKILREKLKNLSTQQMEWINEYCENDMSKLKKISYNAFFRYGIPNYEQDELYDDALNVLMESVISFDSNKGANFLTYLTNNIKKSVIDWYRDNYQRCKRKNLLTDKNGKIVKVDKDGNVTDDDKGNPIIIPNISFDAPTEEDNDLIEKIASDFSVEDSSEFNFSGNEKVEEFLISLPTMARNILELKMEGVDVETIKQKLDITDSEYSRNMKIIKSNEKLELFTKTTRHKEDTEMNIMPMDVTDSYRMDKYPLGTLLDEKRDKKINCQYILQRKAFQWTKKQKNKFLTRILNNQPIPEIVICEQIIGDKKKRHLIDGLQRLSYASQFRAKGSVIEEEGAEFPDIYYTEYVIDENGEYILDEDGDPKVEKKVFNVIGKKFDQLPKFLQDRFNKFNVNVTTFFNCTDEQIAYHIRNYNNQAPMNNNQYDMTCMNPQIVEMIKDISQNNLFFKDKYGKYTNSNDVKGAIERLVAECIMSVNFLDSWKDKTNLLFPYIEEHATKNMFDSLSDLFTRLCNIVTKETKELFNTSNTTAWIAVFEKFTRFGLNDNKFAEFLEYFIKNMDVLKYNGEYFNKIYKDRHPKNKGIITSKIDGLIALMNEFLHIDITETNNTELENTYTEENKQDNTEETILSFVQENANPEATEEDIDEYTDLVDYCFNHNQIKIDIPLYQKCQMALIALMAYACKNNREDDFEKWIKTYQNQTTFSLSQKDNYTYMKESMNRLAVA